MEPPVISHGKIKGQLVVLEIIFPHIHMVSVAGNVVERCVPDLYFFAGKLALDVSGLRQFFFDSGEIVLSQGNVQGSLDGFQISDIVLCLLTQFGQCLKGPFLLIVFGKIPLSVFLGGLCGIQGDGDHFVRIVIERFQLFRSFRYVVTVGVDEFAVDLIFLPILRIL